MRYRYVSFKYSRKARPDATLQNIWETFGAWTVPMTDVWRPPTDVYETPGELIVLLEVAGVSEENFSVTLFSDHLVVEGSREQPPECSKPSPQACHQLGIKYGQFRSEVLVPVQVDHDRVSAEYKNGLLKIILKKRP